MLRLGRVERIHADLRQFSDEFLTQDISSVDELDKFYASKVLSRFISFCVITIIIISTVVDFLITKYTVVQKNTPTLADYNYEPVQSILDRHLTGPRPHYDLHRHRSWRGLDVLMKNVICHALTTTLPRFYHARPRSRCDRRDSITILPRAASRAHCDQQDLATLSLRRCHALTTLPV